MDTPRSAEEVYEAFSEVPQKAFSDPDVVVEKFIPETEGDLVIIRTHVFFGENVTSYQLRSKSQVVKFRNVVDFKQIEVDPEVVEITSRLNVDFGKIDYVVHDGKACVFDVNKTPSGSGKGVRSSEQIVANQRYRARGLYAYLDD